MQFLITSRPDCSTAGLRGFCLPFLVALGTLLGEGLAARAANQSASDDQRGSVNSEAIQSAIRQDLDDTQSIRVDDIQVQCSDGIVTLYGTVESLMEKRRASTIAKRTRDVQAVLNQIIVAPSDRQDDQIRDDVLMRIRANDSLEKQDVVVSVTNGEVAIAGYVESLAEKRLSEIAAAGVRGVRAVTNQLAIKPTIDRPDLELREEIQALITNSVYLDNVDIDVRVENSIVHLAGSVASAVQKDYLEEIAEIWGILEVDVDEVSVDPQRLDNMQRKRRFADVSDETIQDAVGRVFRNDPTVFASADAITVETQKGTVTLSGSVSRLRIKDRAERLAMDVVGVARVNNQLEVTYDRDTPSDLEIIRLTQEALLRSPYLNRREIRVHCHRAHTRLFGIVDNELEKKIAGWVAGGIPGVVHVNNSLAVEREWTPKSDQKIAADLNRKLKYALFEESNDIRVEVEDGVAILSGKVDTWRQWQAALDLAIEAGARHPHNLLDVRYHPPHGASRIFVPR